MNGTQRSSQDNSQAVAVGTSMKKFHITGLVALCNGQFLSASAVDELVEIVQFVRGQKPRIRDLAAGRLNDVIHHVELELPFLMEIEKPELTSRKEITQWSQLLEGKYGAFHEIACLPRAR